MKSDNTPPTKPETQPPLHPHAKALVLASASKYRNELLERLGLPFTAKTPLIDEEMHKDPTLEPRALAEKLAFLKGHSLAGPDQVVIGGDQLVAFRGHILGKPHTIEKACQQLMDLQGHEHELITAVCVFDGTTAHPFTDITRLRMKKLSAEQVLAYVRADQPLDCAGSYKIEKQGIRLFDRIQSEDFSAIQGLPLIQLSKVLHTLGFPIP